MTQLTTLGLATSGDLTTLGTVIGTAFDAIDVDASGFLTADELTTALSGIATDETINDVIAALDTNHDGQVSELEAIGEHTDDTVTGVDSTIDALRDLVGETELNSVRLTSLNTTLEALLAHYDEVAARQAAADRAAAEAEAERIAAEAAAQPTAAELEAERIEAERIEAERRAEDIAIAQMLSARVDALQYRNFTPTTEANDSLLVDAALDEFYKVLNDMPGIDRWKQWMPNRSVAAVNNASLLSMELRKHDLSLEDLPETLWRDVIGVPEGITYLTRDTFPQFADGGMHSGGLRLVGERGPELEVTGPARYWSAEDTAAMLRPRSDTSYSAMLAELQALRSEVSELRIEARATASHTAKSRRILERVTRDGDAMQTEALV